MGLTLTRPKKEPEPSIYDSSLIVNSYEYNYVVQKLRTFFLNKGFTEAHPQNRLSILAACEDPWTVASFNYDNKVWPLPQTGQMWLEYELLKNPKAKGFFCQSTSYRQEPKPVEGRHDLIFPLFEFELHGDMNELSKMEEELLEYLGYPKHNFTHGDYNEIAEKYNVKELEHKHEEALNEDYSPTYFLCNFPEHTDPFWNMKRDSTTSLANKIDVILSGQETIGSAERETDKQAMRDRFNTISDGKYKKKLYDLFGKARTDKEIEDYLSFDFFTRSGGGIGITRLIRSMKKVGLIPPDPTVVKDISVENIV